MLANYISEAKHRLPHSHLQIVLSLIFLISVNCSVKPSF